MSLHALSLVNSAQMFTSQVEIGFTTNIAFRKRDEKEQGRRPHSFWLSDKKHKSFRVCLSVEMCQHSYGWLITRAKMHCAAFLNSITTRQVICSSQTKPWECGRTNLIFEYLHASKCRSLSDELTVFDPP